MKIDMLINVVSDALDANKDYLAFCRELRTKQGLLPKESIWIPSLSGNDAHRLGELCERESAKWSGVAQICHLMGLESDLLIATVKSIKRWEAHNGLYDRSLCLQIKGVKDRVLRFLSNENCEDKYFHSTGRLKPWCEPKKA